MDEGSITRKDLLDSFRLQGDEQGNITDAKASSGKPKKFEAKYRVFDVSDNTERAKLEKIYTDSFNRSDIVIVSSQSNWDKNGNFMVALFWAEEAK